MEFAFCCGVLGGRGLAPQAFRCESMHTPLNFTYILPYNCPCFARMRDSFTSVDLSSVDLSTCRHVNLSTCLPVNLSTCQPVDLSKCQPVDLSTCRHVDLSTCHPVTCYMAIYGVCILLRESWGLDPRHSVVNQCLLH